MAYTNMIKIIAFLSVALLIACNENLKPSDELPKASCTSDLVRGLAIHSIDKSNRLTDELSKAQAEIARLNGLLNKRLKQYDDLNSSAEYLAMDMCATLEEHIGYDATVRIYSMCEH